MTTVCPLSANEMAVPVGITIEVLPAGTYNPYIISDFGNVGKSWRVMVIGCDLRAVFDVSMPKGETSPPSATRICANLAADIELSQLETSKFATKFTCSRWESDFALGVIGRRADLARKMGIGAVRAPTRPVNPQPAPPVVGQPKPAAKPAVKPAAKPVPKPLAKPVIDALSVLDL